MLIDTLKENISLCSCVLFKPISLFYTVFGILSQVGVMMVTKIPAAVAENKFRVCLIFVTTTPLAGTSGEYAMGRKNSLLTGLC